MVPQNRRRQVRSNFGQRNVQRVPNPFFRSAVSGIKFVGGRAAMSARSRINRFGSELKERTISRLRDFSQKEEAQFERSLEFRLAQRKAREEQLRLRKITLDLKKRYAVELNEIRNELKKMIDLIQKNSRIKFRNLNPAVIERISINLFTQFGNKTNFVLQRDPKNKMALKEILISAENQISQNQVKLKSATNNPLEAQKIENIINDSIKRTFDKFQEQGIALKT